MVRLLLPQYSYSLLFPSLTIDNSHRTQISPLFSSKMRAPALLLHVSLVDCFETHISSARIEILPSSHLFICLSARIFQNLSPIEEV
ncbi:unnamed protein product [Prunus brigantina]